MSYETISHIELAFNQTRGNYAISRQRTKVVNVSILSKLKFQVYFYPPRLLKRI